MADKFYCKDCYWWDELDPSVVEHEDGVTPPPMGLCRHVDPQQTEDNMKLFWGATEELDRCPNYWKYVTCNKCGKIHGVGVYDLVTGEDGCHRDLGF